ncbi:hypothetical protein MRX96_008179 [Rhipicephalus microplus]|uniref:Uncharacterized protein n=1 Tax=Rhipicephalus microplus TaxID=6941 RepID=A0A9J6D5U8_RHIMP|nr:hypothetical protein HPB51_017418 [Rhipicephalus microplus]
MVGHWDNIYSRPQSARCGRCGSHVVTTSEAAAEHECTLSCLICGGSQQTGAADCRDKYRKPIKSRMSLSNTNRRSALKEVPFSTKKPSSVPGKPGQIKTTDKAETRTKNASFNFGHFPSLANGQTKVSGWFEAWPD